MNCVKLYMKGEHKMFIGEEGYKAYKKHAVQYMRPYEVGESMEGVSVAIGEKPEVGGMIAISEKDTTDKWYMAKKFFEANYEAVEDDYEPEVG